MATSGLKVHDHCMSQIILKYYAYARNLTKLLQKSYPRHKQSLSQINQLSKIGNGLLPASISTGSKQK